MFATENRFINYFEWACCDPRTMANLLTVPVGRPFLLNIEIKCSYIPRKKERSILKREQNRNEEKFLRKCIPSYCAAQVRFQLVGFFLEDYKKNNFGLERDLFVFGVCQHNMNLLLYTELRVTVFFLIFFFIMFYYMCRRIPFFRWK